MKLIMAVTKPGVESKVLKALREIGILGVTGVQNAKGRGRQKGPTELYRGALFPVDFLPKEIMLFAVPDELVNDARKVIVQAAYTGRPGDGRVFVLPLMEAWNIRTGNDEAASS